MSLFLVSQIITDGVQTKRLQTVQEDVTAESVTANTPLGEGWRQVSIDVSPFDPQDPPPRGG